MNKSGVPMLEKIASNPNFNPIYGAPVAVVISTDKADNPNTAGMARANAACAGENILLAATELGLGSCYLESPTLAFNIPAISETAGIPENAKRRQSSCLATPMMSLRIRSIPKIRTTFFCRVIENRGCPVAFVAGLSPFFFSSMHPFSPHSGHYAPTTAIIGA